MGYRLNRLDEPVFMAVPKPLQTEFGIHYRLESCASKMQLFISKFVTEQSAVLSELLCVFGIIHFVVLSVNNWTQHAQRKT